MSKKMTEILGDEKFSEQCKKFNLDWGKFFVYEIKENIDIIAAPTVNCKIIVIMDMNYNVIGYADKLDAETINKVYEIYEKCAIFDQNISTERDTFFNCTFKGVSVKKIVDLSDELGLFDPKLLKGGASKEYEDLDMQYIQAASLIKYLKEEIQIYHELTFSLRMINAEIPTISRYLSRLINAIDECVSIQLSEGKRPLCEDILEYLGRDRDLPGYTSKLLDTIIEGFMREKNMKDNKNNLFTVIPANYEKLETTSFEKIKENLLKRYNHN